MDHIYVKKYNTKTNEMEEVEKKIWKFRKITGETMTQELGLAEK